MLFEGMGMEFKDKSILQRNILYCFREIMYYFREVKCKQDFTTGT